MATIVGPYGAISSGVDSAGASPSGFVYLGSFSATSGSTLPNLSVGPATPAGTFAGMGVCYSGAISSPFRGGGLALSTNDLTKGSWPELPNLSVGEGSRFQTNFSQQGFANARGYLYYQSSTVNVATKLNGQATAFNSFAQKDNGSFQLFVAVETEAIGESRILEGIVQKSIGEARVLLLAEIKGAGYAKWLNNFDLSSWGQFNVELTSIVAKVNGSYFVLGPYSNTVTGKSRVLLGCETKGQGLHGRQASFVATVIGKSRVVISFATALKGKYGSSTSFTGIKLNGASRKQDNTTAGYVAYVGSGSVPNFSNPPAAYSAELPLEVSLAPPISGTLTYHVVIRKRNSYGVESQNQQAVLVTLDTAGNRILQPVELPSNVAVRVNPNSAVMVVAQYSDYLVADDPADKWKIWISSSAININDPPMAEFNVTESRMMALLDPLSAGTYNYKVGLYRTEDDALSVASGTFVVEAAPVEPVGVPGMATILDS